MLCMGGGDYKEDKKKKKHEVIEFASDMELRDHFAGAVLQGFIANPQTNDIKFKELSKLCYKIADEMMKARES